MSAIAAYAEDDQSLAARVTRKLTRAEGSPGTLAVPVDVADLEQLMGCVHAIERLAERLTR